MRSLLSYWGTLALMLFLGLPSLRAQKMLPDAPIIDFTLPIFSENGYKQLELSGHEGRYQGEGHILILLMNLRIFSGKADVRLQSIISSPDATFDLNSRTAWGQGTLHVQGEHYRVRGKHWLWRGELDHLHIQNGARVEFDHALGTLLR